jgi:prepilin-type processing-associated H-X9-DG protein
VRDFVGGSAADKYQVIKPTSRAGSYAINGWFTSDKLGSTYSGHPYAQSSLFRNESSVQYPALTPLLGDGVYFWSLPSAQNGPAENLQAPDVLDWTTNMKMFCIPRHGKRPLRIPTSWPAHAPLPGSVNAFLFDGHVEAVPLERLWSFYWHKDWIVPAKRPGLK